MKIGIVSENYDNDSHALKALLEKYVYKKDQKIAFRPIARKLEGDQLLTPKAVRIINLDCERYDIDLVILAKDLDSLPSDKKKIDNVKKRIKQLVKKVNLDIIPFIMIFEQEALILADIQTFNNIYGTSSAYKKNPKFQSEPKEFLKQLTRKSKRKYQESDTPEIFQALDFDTVRRKHSGDNSFQSFIKDLESAII